MPTNWKKVEQILKKYPKAKRIAVENFTMSRQDNHRNNLLNLAMDARLYNWNQQTVNAIRDCLYWHEFNVDQADTNTVIFTNDL